MKKGIKTVLAGALLATTLIAGCSGITPITNKEKGILFNGGGVVSVGDHLIFANGFVSGVEDFSTSSDSEYKKAQKYAYLSRTDMSKFEGSISKNENQVNKLSDKVVGYANTYMFVKGNNLYYATPNLHKTKENKHVWKYVTFFKSDLNGGGQKEIYTTKAYDSSKAEIRALEYNDKYYIVIFDGTNIVKIDLSNDKASTISSKATSVALPDENEQWDGNIYYTESRESDVGQAGNITYKASIESGKSEQICNRTDITISFTGRVKDTLFYSMTKEGISITETYIYDTVSQKGSIDTAGSMFYSLPISNVEGVAENNTEYNGFTFTVSVSSKTQVLYYNSNKAANNVYYESEMLLGVDEDYTDYILDYGTDFYYTTSSGIFKVDLVSKNTQKIVSDMTIKNGVYGYDYKYVDGEISRLNNIYFYAQIVEDEETEEKESDENYYLYSIDKDGLTDPVLVGKKA